MERLTCSDLTYTAIKLLDLKEKNDSVLQACCGLDGVCVFQKFKGWTSVLRVLMLRTGGTFKRWALVEVHGFLGRDALRRDECSSDGTLVSFCKTTWF